MHRSPATAINFRDLGGLPIADGGRVRPGVLYRSATPQFLTAADAADLVANTGLQVVDRPPLRRRGRGRGQRRSDRHRGDAAPRPDHRLRRRRRR